MGKYIYIKIEITSLTGLISQFSIYSILKIISVNSLRDVITAEAHNVHF